MNPTATKAKTQDIASPFPNRLPLAASQYHSMNGMPALLTAAATAIEVTTVDLAAAAYQPPALVSRQRSPIFPGFHGKLDALTVCQANPSANISPAQERRRRFGLDVPSR